MDVPVGPEKDLCFAPIQYALYKLISSFARGAISLRPLVQLRQPNIILACEQQGTIVRQTLSSNLEQLNECNRSLHDASRDTAEDAAPSFQIRLRPLLLSLS